MSWYLAVLKKYAVFGGRARRKEYWMFVLVNALIAVGLGVLDGDQGVLAGLYSLAVLVPSLAVSVRRLHDTNRSGWWLLIALIPLAGAIVLLVFTLQDSDRIENRYGPSPKYIVGYPELQVP